MMVDKEARLLRNGIVAEKDSALIEPYIDINISESALIKKQNYDA